MGDPTKLEASSSPFIPSISWCKFFVHIPPKCDEHSSRGHKVGGWRVCSRFGKTTSAFHNVKYYQTNGWFGQPVPVARNSHQFISIVSASNSHSCSDCPSRSFLQLSPIMIIPTVTVPWIDQLSPTLHAIFILTVLCVVNAQICAVFTVPFSCEKMPCNSGKVFQTSSQSMRRCWFQTLFINWSSSCFVKSDQVLAVLKFCSCWSADDYRFVVQWMVRDFEAAIESELDLAHEAENLEKTKKVIRPIAPPG